MGMADFILAVEGDLYDIYEYHMLAHLIINKVDDFGTFLTQSVHEDVGTSIIINVRGHFTIGIMGVTQKLRVTVTSHRVRLQ